MKINQHQFSYSGHHIKISGIEEDHIFKQISKYNSFYEYDLLEEIAHYPLKEGIIIDVGSNIGNHTIFFAKVLHKHVHAFEPLPDAFSLLEKNINDNNIINLVTLHNKAVSDKQKHGFVVPGKSENIGRSYLSDKALNNAISVKCVALDNLYSNKKIALIKMDIEGGEINALHGAKKILGEHKPILVLEADQITQKHNIIQFLNQFSYRLITTKANTDTLIFAADHQISELGLVRLDQRTTFQNILFIKNKLTEFNKGLMTLFEQLNNLGDKISVKQDSFQEVSEKFNEKIDSLIEIVHQRNTVDKETLQKKLLAYQNQIEEKFNHNIQIASYDKEKSDLLEKRLKHLVEARNKRNEKRPFFKNKNFESWKQYTKRLNKKLLYHNNLDKVFYKLNSCSPSEHKYLFSNINTNNNSLDFSKIESYFKIYSDFDISLVFQSIFKSYPAYEVVNNIETIYNIMIAINKVDLFAKVLFENLNLFLEISFDKINNYEDIIKILKLISYDQLNNKLKKNDNILKFFKTIISNIFKKTKCINKLYLDACSIFLTICDYEELKKINNTLEISEIVFFNNIYFTKNYIRHPLIFQKHLVPEYFKFVKENIFNSMEYVIASFFTSILNKQNDFSEEVLAFSKMSIKNQKKTLNKIRRSVGFFNDKKINLDKHKLTEKHFPTIFLLSLFANGSEFVSVKDIGLSGLSSDLYFLIVQNLTGKNQCYSFINKILTDNNLININFEASNVQNLFKEISNIYFEKKIHFAEKCSVIITTFNPIINLLDLSIRSILNQSYKNIEIIIVDDKSDNSLDIENLVNKFDNIVYIKNTNNIGPYLSRNKALEVAKGSYIAFQDDDDVSHPQRLEFSINNLKISSAKIIHTAVIRFCQNGHIQLDSGVDSIFSDGPVSMVFHRDLINVLGNFWTIRSRGDVEYRARCIKKFGVESYKTFKIPLYYALGSGNSLSNLFEYGRNHYALEIYRDIIRSYIEV